MTIAGRFFKWVEKLGQGPDLAAEQAARLAEFQTQQLDKFISTPQPVEVVQDESKKRTILILILIAAVVLMFTQNE